MSGRLSASMFLSPSSCSSRIIRSSTSKAFSSRQLALRHSTSRLPTSAQIYRSIHTTQRNMATTQAGEVVSEVAKAEGGPTKGSESAKMQSELDKAQNAQQGTSANNKTGSNKSPEGQAISEQARAEGGGGPTKGSKSAAMQSQLTKQRNAEQGIGQNAPASANGTGNVASPNEQSQQHREENFQEAIDEVAPKMANAPETVTKEDGDLLHSREQRARGVTEKGGIASQAQQMASENKA